MLCQLNVCGFLALVSGVVAQAPQHLVVPAAYGTTDAPSYVWVAGASDDVRQQTLVGPTHLTQILGRPIWGIEFRRTAANEVYAGGSANLTVTLSTAPNDPLNSSVLFADNVGNDAVQVFQGTVTIPTSPAVVGPSVGWTAANVIQIPFQVPFTYLGGTLCVDITGTKITGQTADWWMADADYEDLDSSVAEIGPGCGPYTNSNGQWSFVSERSLVTGGYAEMWAYGPPGSFGIAVIGDEIASPIELTLLQIPSPGCYLYLSAFHNTELVPFVLDPNPQLAHRGGRANFRIKIPNQPWTLGAMLATQWLELSQLYASNGIRWQIATTPPQLDMALLDGVPGDPSGKLTLDMAHVLRFEYQAP